MLQTALVLDEGLVWERKLRSPAALTTAHEKTRPVTQRICSPTLYPLREYAVRHSQPTNQEHPFCLRIKIRCGTRYLLEAPRASKELQQQVPRMLQASRALGMGPTPRRVEPPRLVGVFAPLRGEAGPPQKRHAA